MPDEPKVDLAPTWKQVIRDVAQAIIAIASVIGIWLASHNSGKIDDVKNTQQEVRQETVEVKKTLDAKTAVDEAKAVEYLEAERTKLYGNWKALDWIAESPEEKKKAEEAKKVWESFHKKHPPK